MPPSQQTDANADANGTRVNSKQSFSRHGTAAEDVERAPGAGQKRRSTEDEQESSSKRKALHGSSSPRPRPPPSTSSLLVSPLSPVSPLLTISTPEQATGLAQVVEESDDELSDALDDSDDDSDESEEEEEQERRRDDESGEDEEEDEEEESEGKGEGEGVDVGRDYILGSVMENYESSLMRWRKWCTRKRYADSNTVTREKLIRYAQEATAREAYVDDENPHLNIEPFISAGGNTGRAQPRPTKGSMSNHLTAVRALYKEQQLKLGKIPNIREDLGFKEVAAILKEYGEWLKNVSTDKGQPDMSLRLRNADQAKVSNRRRAREGKRQQQTKCDTAKLSMGDNSSKKVEGEAEITPQGQRASFRADGYKKTQKHTVTTSGLVLKYSDRDHVFYRNWKEWCVRKLFTDGERVTREKAGAYAAEMAATEAYEDRENPHLSIVPLMAYNKHASTATMYKNMGFVRKLFAHQCEMEGFTPDLKKDFWPSKFEDIIQEYEKFLKDSASCQVDVDVGANGRVKVNNNRRDIRSYSASKSKENTKFREGQEEEVDANSESKRLQKITYRRQWNHWKDWCTRKRCTDGEKVTGDKLLAYAKEIMAEKAYYDKNRPHRNIEPLFAHTTSKEQTPRRLSAATFLTHFTAMRRLYRDQCSMAGIVPDVKRDLRLDDIEVVIENYSEFLKKGEDSDSTNSGQFGRRLQDSEKTDNDQHANNDKHAGIDKRINNGKEEKRHGARYPMAPLKKYMKRLWAVKLTNTSPSHRQLVLQDRFRTGFEFFTYDSAHNPTEVLASQLHLIRVESLEGRRQVTTGVAMDKGLRKSRTDHERYSIFLREKDVEICPVGALAFYLLAVWKDEGTAPNFHTWDWENDRLLTIKSVSKALPTLRPTSTDAIVATVNDSRLECLTPLFLSGSPQTQPYMLVGTLQELSAFEIPRSKVIPPAELQRQLFPFVEDFFRDKNDWRIWIDNVMMGRPEETNRPKEQQASYPIVSYPAIRLLLLLAQLRRIILQDYAVLMAGEDERSGERCLDISHTFAIQHPVFSSSAFRKFASKLRDSTNTGSAKLIRMPTASASAAASSSAAIAGPAFAAVVTTASGAAMRSHSMDEESMVQRLVQQGIPPEDFQRPLPQQHSAASFARLSPTRAADRNSSVNRDRDEDSRGNESSDFALLRPVLQALNDKVESLQQEKKDLSERNLQLQDQLDQAVAKTSHRPVSGIQAMIYDASLHDLRDENQSLRERLAVLEEEKKEAYLIATEATNVTDTLNHRVTELQEMVEGMWTMQAEAEAKVACDSMRQFQDQQALLRVQMDMIRQRMITDERMATLTAALEKSPCLEKSPGIEESLGFDNSPYVGELAGVDELAGLEKPPELGEMFEEVPE